MTFDPERTLPRMRRLKWAPFGLLAAASVSLVLEIAYPDLHLAWMSMTIGTVSLAGVLSWYGPMRTKQAAEEIDEREALWRSRSNLFAYGAAALIAWVGLVGLGGYALWAGLTGWTVRSAVSPLETFGAWLIDWAVYVMVLFLALPTLHASWTMPDIIADEPEDRPSFRKLGRR